MATVTGNEYDHITISDGTNSTVHYLKDTAARNNLINMLNTIDIMTDKSTYGNNNTAVTNNGDGSVTIGTTDNGNTTFGSPIELTAGDYYLYGVPNGIAFLTTVETASSSYTNRVFENSGSVPKRYHTDSTISVYVAFRSPSRPSTAYTIYPALYKLEPVDRSLLTKKPISFNGNYFTDAESVWYDGFYKTASGVIDTSNTLQYAYCPLVGAGNYTLVIRYSDFGSNSTVIGFADNQFRFAKSTTGTRDGNNISYSVTDNDLIRCKYTIIRRDKTKDFSPKLFYNATPAGGIYKLNPVYGYDTDPLYKKIVVCDGDSICAGATYDNPKRYGAWYGRLVNNYQVSGHNYGVNGASITDLTSTTPSRHSVALNIDTIHTDYPALDYLILEGGTNDADLIGGFNGDTPPEGFGTWSDENVSDYNGSYDNTTFCGAVEELFYKAVTYYPNAKIGFIIPMQMGTLMVPTKRRRRYFDEIIKIAKKWHINVLDLWNICHADARVSAYYSGTEGDLTKFYYDGQHPTSVGYDMLQPMIEAWMKTL